MAHHRKVSGKLYFLIIGVVAAVIAIAVHCNRPDVDRPDVDTPDVDTPESDDTEETAVVMTEPSDSVISRELQDDPGFQWNLTLTQNGKRGAEDLDGNEIVKPIFTDIVYYSGIYNGVFNAYMGDTVAVYSKDGANIISPNFGFEYYDFCTDGDENADNTWIRVQKNDLYGAMTVTGDMLIPTEYKEVVFMWGRFQLKQCDDEWIELNIDTKGNVNIKPEGQYYIEGKNTSIGRMPGYYEVVNDKGLVGVKDENGNEIIPPIYDYIVGTRCYYGFKNGYVAVYDTHGKCLIPLSRKYNSATYLDNCIEVTRGYDVREYLENGLYCPVNKGYEATGICNLLGDEILPPGEYEIEEYGRYAITYSDKDGCRHNVALNNPRFKEPPIWVRNYVIEDNAVDVSSNLDLVSGIEQVVEIAYFEDYLIEDGIYRLDLTDVKPNGTRVYHNSAGWGGGSDYYLSGSNTMYKITYCPGMGPIAPYTTRQSMRMTEEKELGFYNSGKTPPTCNATSSNNNSSENETVANPVEYKVSTDPLKCYYCNGSGRREINQSIPSFGIESKKKCEECGKWFYVSTGHSHIECRYCHGTGRR